MTPPRGALELRAARRLETTSGLATTVIAVNQQELAALFGVDRGTVRTWEALGLPFFEVGRCKRYPVEGARHWAAEMARQRAERVAERRDHVMAGGSGIRLTRAS